MLNATGRLPKAEIPPHLHDVMERVAAAAGQLSLAIARAGIERDLNEAVGVNKDGDTQSALDVLADGILREALRGSRVRHYASEELDAAITLNAAGELAFACDPLDGSSNIGVNVPVGTIFSVYPAAGTPEASFLRPVSAQIAAGYVIYGPQTSLVVSFGQGVQKYTRDPETGQFHCVSRDVRIPPSSPEFSINASNHRYWPAPVRAYIDDLIAGAEGPRGKDFNMRWVASLVAETHRIMTRGGIFLYPADSRKGYEQGRLRLLYECAPIAFLAVQAGGGATDGVEPILGLTVEALHMRTPFVFGSIEKVVRVAAYHELPEAETSALFGKRGLFRS